jgi:hypothetical protein
MTLPNRIQLVAAVLVLVPLSGAVAYWRAFSSIKPYDDEGGLMFGLREFQRGSVLYDKVPSIYGPMYYIYQSVPYILTGAPASHDSVRFVSTVFRTGTGLLFFFLVFGITRSVAWALVAHYFAFRFLAFVGDETAHPAEICIFLLVALCLAAKFRGRMLWFGVLCGAMAVSKINVGIIACAALAPIVSCALPRSKVRNVLVGLSVAGITSFPLRLMWGGLGQPAWLYLSLIITISTTSSLIMALSDESEGIGWPELGVLVVSCIMTVLAVCSIVVMRGTTPGAIINDLVVFPASKFIRVMNQPPHVSGWALLWCAVNLCLAAWARWGRIPFVLLTFLRFAMGAIVVWHFVDKQYVSLFTTAAPMMWLLIAPVNNVVVTAKTTRMLLAVLGTIQVCYVYPVAGQQAAFVCVLITAGAIVCVWDALRSVELPTPATMSNLAPIAASILILVLTISSGYSNFRTFESGQSLGIPGAEHLRLEPDLVTTLRHLIAAARNCSMVATLPGLPSFNIWTDRPMVPGTGGGAWMLGLDDAAQVAAARVLQEQPRACAIYYPHALRMWFPGSEPKSGPLVVDIVDRMRVEFEDGGYLFMTRP